VSIVRLNWECWKSFGFGRTAKTVLTALLILQLLSLLALAACPALHHALHPDSNSPDHGCLVTLFAKGHLSESALTPVVFILAAFVVCAMLLTSFLPRLLFDYRFAPSRAPPCF
jgi:hypothetical protein